MSRHERNKQARRRRHAALGGAAAVALLGVGASPAHAATFTVTTTADDGAGSLRDAITQANADSDPDTILFDASVSGTITLASSLTVEYPVTITGPGAAALTLEGTGTAPVLETQYGPSAISGLTIAGGSVGIRNVGSSLSLADVVLSGNGLSADPNSREAAAGGVFSIFGTLALDRVAVTGNASASGGGGIDTFGGSLTVHDSTISGNTADGGGGGGVAVLSSKYGASASSTITDSTVVENGANGPGGGLFVGTAGGNASPVTVTLAGSTVSGNDALDGGGIGVAGGNTVALDSTAVGADTAFRGAKDLFSDADAPGTFSAQRSLVTDPGTIDLGGGAITGQDPLLGPLQDNGGPTLTELPGFGSPLLDAGEQIAAQPETTDQRGLARTVDLPDVENAADGTDIGAAEAQSAPAAPPATGPTGASGAAGTDAGTTTTVTTTTPPPASPAAPAAHPGTFVVGARYARAHGGAVQVVIPAAGDVVVSGRGIVKVSRSYTGDGVKQLDFRLGKATRKRLKAHHAVTLRLVASYTATGLAPARERFRLRLEP